MGALASAEFSNRVHFPVQLNPVIFRMLMPEKEHAFKEV
jgi:hypothetical protein